MLLLLALVFVGGVLSRKVYGLVTPIHIPKTISSATATPTAVATETRNERIGRLYAYTGLVQNQDYLIFDPSHQPGPFDFVTGVTYHLAQQYCLSIGKRLPWVGDFVQGVPAITIQSDLFIAEYLRLDWYGTPIPENTFSTYATWRLITTSTNGQIWGYTTFDDIPPYFLPEIDVEETVITFRCLPPR
jgi:hypothetical protein